MKLFPVLLLVLVAFVTSAKAQKILKDTAAIRAAQRRSAQYQDSLIKAYVAQQQAAGQQQARVAVDSMQKAVQRRQSDSAYRAAIIAEYLAGEQRKADRQRTQDSLQRQDSLRRADSLKPKRRLMYFGVNGQFALLGGSTTHYSLYAEAGFNASKRITVGAMVGYGGVSQPALSFALLSLYGNINYRVILRKKLALGIDAKAGIGFSSKLTEQNKLVTETSIPGIFTLGPSATVPLKKHRYLQFSLSFMQLIFRQKYSGVVPAGLEESSTTYGGLAAGISYRF